MLNRKKPYRNRPLSLKMAEMKSPNVHAKKNRNDTPRKRKTHIIKVRVTAEEKLRIAYACKELHLTQSELVRRVLYGVNVKHTVVVAQGGEDALAALAALSAQCSKVGSNLNQLARHFNSGGKDTEQLRAQILEELSALTNFRLKAEETVGELYGNHQAIIRLLGVFAAGVKVPCKLVEVASHLAAPVSYTHLDVYKRQEYNRQHGVRCGKNPINFPAADPEQT